MGKNHKSKAKTNGNFVSAKRKVSSVSESDESPVKNKKVKTEDEWFPGKFVLLNRKNQSEQPQQNCTSNDTPTAVSKSTKKRDKKSKKPSAPAKNGESSKSKTKITSNSLASLYNGDISSSDDSFDAEEFESLSEEEQVSEEWETDTDYEMMDDEDCDSGSSHIESEAEYDCDYDSDEDEDYVPQVEDVYIARGTAKIYDAKGLDLAFGNSTESQIIEISDVQPAQDVSMCENEEIPRLVTLDGEEVDEDADDEDEDIGNETEKLIKELQIDDEDDTVGICESSQSRLLKNANFYNCQNNQGVLVVLRETIHFHGVLLIKSLVNSVQINGFELTEGAQLTAKSISHADFFINLTPVIKSPNNHNLTAELSNLLAPEILTSLSATFNPLTESLLHLHEGFVDPKLQMLVNFLPHPLLPSKKQLLANRKCQSSELLLSTRFFLASENHKISTFSINPQWSNLRLTSSSRLLITGGKNVGKSTLSQYLINANLAKFGKILLIDLDIGQPISHAAQTISATLVAKPIIGLGCLDATLQPEKLLLYGDKNVMISPFKYVRCVRELIEFCEADEKLQNVPWIINTMGYQKGFGLQLIALLIRLMRPTDVVQIQHSVKSYNFAKLLTDSLVDELDFSFFENDDVMQSCSTEKLSFTTHIVDSIVNNNAADINSKWISNASEKRKMSMIAQLAKLLKGNTTSLHDVTPFKASIDKFRTVVMDEEYRTGAMGCSFDLLNANLVYLCKDCGDDASADAIYECFGIGLVRAIDKANRQVYILLPTNVDGLEKRLLQANINVLAICNISLPSEILMRQGYGVGGKLPYVTCQRDKMQSSNKYFSKRHIKDCF